ncbi:DUF1778 domain-containing protein [Megamonas hypermegale]|jgi:uncharacterized protein (DUF1778 family)|uniref:Uncharacterized protein conserved in bacteria n=1 Tax=Megamonas hypermegale TaxID=158847 RepID=A0A239TJK7_9FIRM|nr:DUF1778 domain-containing protein [Megamonas hypermegale]MBM6834031.1 DUF1778 domain-containing protein [Megamonas hypermegale]OUO41608.1 DUF1778 domain-containing protein [Megamonas hypermegale]SNU97906.1 Uncharacterized protein conserved in bacteria [Megamonas hypermegale]HJG07049.1 DUF1778 domain-containing protein [Megamonas hypermegale]
MKTEQEKNKKTKRLQLNIRLTPQQNEYINKRLKETQKNKTQFVLDCINENPIYILPHLEQTISQIKYLGNKTNELSQRLDQSNEENKKLIQELQKGCDEFWRLLKLLKQEKPKQV